MESSIYTVTERLIMPLNSSVREPRGKGCGCVKKTTQLDCVYGAQHQEVKY